MGKAHSDPVGGISESEGWTAACALGIWPRGQGRQNPPGAESEDSVIQSLSGASQLNPARSGAGWLSCEWGTLHCSQSLPDETPHEKTETERSLWRTAGCVLLPRKDWHSSSVERSL